MNEIFSLDGSYLQNMTSHRAFPRTSSRNTHAYTSEALRSMLYIAGYKQKPTGSQNNKLKPGQISVLFKYGIKEVPGMSSL